MERMFFRSRWSLVGGLALILGGGGIAACSKFPPPVAKPINSAEVVETTEAAEPTASVAGREFTLLVYNVENLFDVDGVAAYEDYQMSGERPYTPRHFAHKLENIVRTLRHVNQGAGPEIICLQEVENDQTPDAWDGSIANFVNATRGRTVRELLQGDGWRPWRGVAAYAWLYKALIDEGWEDYEIAVGAGPMRDAAGGQPAVVNVTLSRFPIRSSRTIALPHARGILETAIDVDGHLLMVFNNHWKSGAGREEFEQIRIEQARILRARLDEILAARPMADIILAGDFNSQHNQSQRFPQWRLTAVNHVLGSTGDPSRLLGGDRVHFYNLWYELPPDQRGSEVYQGQWGTLIQIMVSPGLFELQGIQYVPRSFFRLKIPGFNTQPVTGVPRRWEFLNDGFGVSDHLPVGARFRTVAHPQPGMWQPPVQPEPDNPQRLRVDYSQVMLSESWDASKLAREGPLQVLEFYGDIFRVRGVVENLHPFQIRLGDEVFGFWSFDEAFRQAVFGSYQPGDQVEFYAELNQHRGKWQWFVHDRSWWVTPLKVQMTTPGSKLDD